MALKYTKETIDHFTNPHNLGTLEGANAEATEGSPACGDMVAFYLKISKDDVIEKATFESYGCAANIATASITTEMAIRLEKGIGSSAAAWLRMQMAYDLTLAQRSARKIKVKKLASAS